jgi:hypothetical protein
MSLQEAERRRKQSKRDSEAEQDRRDHHLHDEARLRPRVVADRAKPRESVGVGHNRGPPLDQHLTADDLKVLTRKEWAKLNSLSYGTAKRILASGNGPPVIQLTERRVGIRMIDNRRWQESRLRT